MLCLAGTVSEHLLQEMEQKGRQPLSISMASSVSSHGRLASFVLVNSTVM